MKRNHRRRTSRRPKRQKATKYLRYRSGNTIRANRRKTNHSFVLTGKKILEQSPLVFLKESKIFWGALSLLATLTLIWVVSTAFPIKEREETNQITRTRKDQEDRPPGTSGETRSEVEKAEAKPWVKSQEAKEAAMSEDLAYMSSLGLYYDYAHLSLEDTVKAFLAEQGLDVSQVAFSYKNLVTNEAFSMNDTQPMTAGSTYKLPLAMLIIDEVEAGHIDMSEEVNYTTIGNITEAPDYPLYLAGFGETMNWTQILDNALIHSENTPAYIMADRLGGFHVAYQRIAKFGQSKGAVKTIDYDGGNKTTSNYYIQVLDYLWKNKDKYAPIIDRLDASFTNQWYEQYVNWVRVSQKPGYSQEALNVNAIVEEETPYIISLYTAGFGGSNEFTTEINGYGYYQVTCLAYVINEWHRVNMNPAKEAPPLETSTESDYIEN